jgi:hypothetical protein
VIPDWVGQHIAVVLVTCATVAPLSWSLGRAERRGRRVLRRLSVVARAEDERAHRARMLRGELSLELARRVAAPGRYVAVALPPRIETEPRYPWRALIAREVLEYTSTGAELPVVETPDPTPEETRTERDRDEPPAPPALTLTPVSLTAIRRGSLLPGRLLSQARAWWNERREEAAADRTPPYPAGVLRGLRDGAHHHRPNARSMRLIVGHRLPPRNGGRHGYGAAPGTNAQPAARWDLAAASGPSRCIR